MTPGRTIEKKGDTGVQDKDEKTAQGGAMTRQQAEQEMEQLRKVFPSVRMLTAEQVQAGEAVGDAARQALEEKTTHSRMEYRGQELYEVTALFAQVEGTPCVLELERRLDRVMLLDPEESEQLFNNLAEYRGKLYRDAVTGAYNERYYQEKYRSRILTAGVATTYMAVAPETACWKPWPGCCAGIWARRTASSAAARTGCCCFCRRWGRATSARSWSICGCSWRRPVFRATPICTSR